MRSTGKEGGEYIVSPRESCELMLFYSTRRLNCIYIIAFIFDYCIRLKFRQVSSLKPEGREEGNME